MRALSSPPVSAGSSAGVFARYFAHVPAVCSSRARLVRLLVPALLAPFVLTACSGEASPPPTELASPVPVDPTPTPPSPTPQASDFHALASRDCAQVVRFYGDAIATGDFMRAALVWNDPVVDHARLAALFDGYARPLLSFDRPREEGAAGSLHCTVTGSLTDQHDPEAEPSEGALVLRRANDVPGATPDQLRWTIQSSTFIELMERADRGLSDDSETGSNDGEEPDPA